MFENKLSYKRKKIEEVTISGDLYKNLTFSNDSGISEDLMDMKGKN